MTHWRYDHMCMHACVAHLDNREQKGFDIAGGMQGRLAALQEAKQQRPVAAGSAHCCNVHLAPPDLQAKSQAPFASADVLWVTIQSRRSPRDRPV